MIELTQQNGQAIFVNPAHVVAVLPGPGKLTEVVMTAGGRLWVVDSVATVADAMEGQGRLVNDRQLAADGWCNRCSRRGSCDLSEACGRKKADHNCRPAGPVGDADTFTCEVCATVYRRVAGSWFRGPQP